MYLNIHISRYCWSERGGYFNRQQISPLPRIYETESNVEPFATTTLRKLDNANSIEWVNYFYINWLSVCSSRSVLHPVSADYTRHPGINKGLLVVKFTSLQRITPPPISCLTCVSPHMKCFVRVGDKWIKPQARGNLPNLTPSEVLAHVSWSNFLALIMRLMKI